MPETETDRKSFVAGLIAAQQVGQSSALGIASHYLAAIDEHDDEVLAFAHVDGVLVRAEAETRDEARVQGGSLGPLQGVPVALKDVIDTHDMPTENGTEADAERQPTRDAVVVERLREAGGVVLGKTVTAELAFYTPGETRNPHDLTRTPGGSSSGSAAAVGAGMAPLAIGTQTGGSVIRPASFCGTVGFKPSFGLLPRTGVLLQSRDLDTLGVFATSVDDAAVLVDALQGFDDGDPDSLRIEPLPIVAALHDKASTPPRFGFATPPGWDLASLEVEAGLTALCEALGDSISKTSLPDGFEGTIVAQRVLQMHGIARNFASYVERARGALSPRLLDAFAEGEALSEGDVAAARETRERMRDAMAAVFADVDVLVLPSATGEAPLFSEGTTGDPVFCAPWTLLGLPAITLPLLTGANGLPIGVQLVGPYLHDHRLVRIAAGLTQALLAAD